MSISVYIDSNVWNFLFDRKLDLSIELPRDEFCLCLTREAEFEIPPIPAEKAALKEFIEKTIQGSEITTRPYFGFYDESVSANEQRYGGFDVGHWATEAELSFIEQQRTAIGSITKESTKLYKNEADVAVAARSFHSVVLTLDKKTGPLNKAYQQGGKVIFLSDFDSCGITLKEFVTSRLGLVSSAPEALLHIENDASDPMSISNASSNHAEGV